MGGIRCAHSLGGIPVVGLLGVGRLLRRDILLCSPAAARRALAVVNDVDEMSLLTFFSLGRAVLTVDMKKKSGKEGGREEHGNSEFEQRYFKKIVVPHAIRVRSMKRTEPLVDGQYGPHPRAGIDFVFSQTQSSVIFKMNRAVQDFFVQFPYSICFPSNLLTINFNNCDISG